ncbi:sulfite exporter TauE/SafE family protein [Calorimonas adulescens]|uniref:Probable membrane transporter protein n=1 Tax=Calorimonas adulescens TaxID=2606906 RepID=A0A5D8QH63_9THEO|nr:sulfite exporter TauE/SafE family protein [Calorimonas adulescens]TZE83589.1 sulfite exporter TauE/SafE family protein [Calorimonas adulescens]
MIFFAIGLAAGIIGGMGIGGGTIMIPALTIFLNVTQHTSQSINLITFIPMAVVALIIHIRQRNITIKYLLPLITGGILGSVAGSYLAISLSTIILKRIFAIFLLIMGIYEIFSKTPKQ